MAGMAIPETPAGIRLGVAAAAGVLAALLIGGPYGPATGWIVAAVPLGKVSGLASHPGFARFEVSLSYAVEAARAAP